MNLVMIESPYRYGDRNRNLRYLAWCEYHSASLGECPISSHGNCTAYWPEDDEHRVLGFAWRDLVRTKCDLVAYYTDLGVSLGAESAAERDASEGVAFELRRLPMLLLSRFERGENAPGSMRRVVAPC